jgi:hypothetical protein
VLEQLFGNKKALREVNKSEQKEKTAGLPGGVSRRTLESTVEVG